MKTIIVTLLALSMICAQMSVNAQTLNWKTVENSKHILNAGIGLDYSLIYSVGYSYQIKAKIPLILMATFSIPSGENVLDDVKTKFGGQVVLLKKTNFIGGIALNGIYRRYKNPLVTLQNLGYEVKGTMGYYKSTWFVAGEVAFDKAAVTHFKHSRTFKQNILPNVSDGWYGSSTGGNFLYGFQAGYSFKKYDLTLRLGRVITQDFKTTPMIPYYFMIGCNYKI